MLSILLAKESLFGNVWMDGLFTFILGMLVVFLGMLIVVLFISIVGKILNKNSDKSKNVSKEENVGNIENSSDDDIPEHIKVAIIAAIAAYYEGEGPQNSFVVKKIKKLR